LHDSGGGVCSEWRSSSRFPANRSRILQALQNFLPVHHLLSFPYSVVQGLVGPGKASGSLAFITLPSLKRCRTQGLDPSEATEAVRIFLAFQPFGAMSLAGPYRDPVSGHGYRFAGFRLLVPRKSPIDAAARPDSGFEWLDFPYRQQRVEFVLHRRRASQVRFRRTAQYMYGQCISRFMDMLEHSCRHQDFSGSSEIVVGQQISCNDFLAGEALSASKQGIQRFCALVIRFGGPQNVSLAG